jgi:hypothetical protein
MRSFICFLFILPALVLLLPARGIAQEEAMFENRTFYGGLVLGTNLAQVDGDNFAGYHKAGLNAGALVYVKLDEHLAASMEILFSQKGSRATVAQVVQPGVYISKYGIDLNYAEIPVMINYFDSRKSHFGGGLSYAQLANSNEYMTSNLSTVDLSKYPFKKRDINLLLSGNLHLYKGFFLNMRFQYSLLSIRDNVPNVTKGAQYNNTWVVRVMYLFL